MAVASFPPAPIGVPLADSVTGKFVTPWSDWLRLLATEAQNGADASGLWIDVKTRGAIGNGVVDDTAACQAALDEANNLHITCYFSRGRYRITSSLSTSDKGITVRGENRWSALIVNNCPPASPSLVWNDVQHFNIADLGFIGEADFENDAIFLHGTAGVNVAFGTLERLFMQPNGRGIHTTDTLTVNVDDCQWWPSGLNLGASVSPGVDPHDRPLSLKNFIKCDGDFVNDFRVTRCTAVGTCWTTAGGYTIDIDATSSGGIRITANELELGNSAQYCSIRIQNATNVVCDSNFVENTQVIFNACREVKVFGNDEGSDARYIGTNNFAVIVEASNAKSFEFDATNTDCGARDSDFAVAPGYSNSSVNPQTWNVRSVGSVRVPDQGSFLGYKERGRSTAFGEWIAPSFSAGDFTGSGAMTWTVRSSDVGTFTYTLVGLTMTVAFQVNTSSVGGVADVNLRIKIPGGFTAASTMWQACSVNDNGAGFAVAMAQVVSGGTQIVIWKDATLTGNWAASVHLTQVQGTITFAVQ